MLRRELWNQLTELMMSLVIFTMIAVASMLSTRTQVESSVSVDEVYRKLRSGEKIVLLDVRTPQEFSGETGHVEGAILLPIQDLTMRIEELRSFEDSTIVVYCRTDNRSRMAVSILEQSGFSAMRMKGGITAWRAEELPVVLEESK
jgi:rhodanese-related sulfurtransferase